MNEIFGVKELYLGCSCMDLCHVSLFLHFPPNKDDDEEDVIYCTVKVKNYWDKVFPPLRYFYCLYDWQTYFRFHWLHRVWIGTKYILNSNYKRKWGVLDCFDFQGKDLTTLDEFLALITDKVVDTIVDNIGEESECWIDNDYWTMRFCIDRMISGDADFPFELGWDPQFKERGFFGRVNYAFRYVFGILASDEQCFEINKNHAGLIRGMIKWVQEKNNEENNDETR